MADQTNAIAKELDELVTQGHALLFEEAAKSAEFKKAMQAEAKKQTREEKSPPKAKDKASKKKVDTSKEEGKGTFGSRYQRWYSQALRVVEQLLPDRYQEFRDLYRLEKQPSVLDISTYRINDYIQGTRVMKGKVEAFDAATSVLSQFMFQVDILASAQDRIGSTLGDIRGTLEARLLDDELAAAESLLSAKHLRSAGVVTGVVLERHLKRLVGNHEVTFRKKAQIGNLNDALKEAKVYDVPQWRFIQRLGDIRNLCGHDGERDPTGEEVEELVRGTEKVIATVF